MFWRWESCCVLLALIRTRQGLDLQRTEAPSSRGAPWRKAAGTEGAPRRGNQVQAHTRGLDFAASTASRDASVSGGRSRVRGQEAAGTVGSPGLIPPCQPPARVSKSLHFTRTEHWGAGLSPARACARLPPAAVQEPGALTRSPGTTRAGLLSLSVGSRTPFDLSRLPPAYRRTSPLATRRTQRPGRTSELGTPKLPRQSSSAASKSLFPLAPSAFTGPVSCPPSHPFLTPLFNSPPSPQILSLSSPPLSKFLSH